MRRRYWIFTVALLILFWGSGHLNAMNLSDLKFRICNLPEDGLLIKPVDFSALFDYMANNTSSDVNNTSSDADKNSSAGKETSNHKVISGDNNVSSEKNIKSITRKNIAKYVFLYKQEQITSQFIPTVSDRQGILVFRFSKSQIAESQKSTIELDMKIETTNDLKKSLLGQIKSMDQQRVKLGDNYIVFQSGRQGGFPARFEFTASKKVFDFGSFFWEDRLYRKDLGGFNLNLDKKAQIELVSDGPICSVIRSKAKFVNHKGISPEGDPQAIYHWFCFKDQPDIYVQATYRQDKPVLWKELHFCEFHQDKAFTEWLSSEDGRAGSFAGSDKSERFRSIAAVADSNGNALMMFGGNTCVYDGKRSPSSYLLFDPNFAWQSWQTNEQTNSCWIRLTQLTGSLKEKQETLKKIAAARTPVYSQFEITSASSDANAQNKTEGNWRNWRKQTIATLLLEGINLSKKEIQTIANLREGKISEQIPISDLSSKESDLSSKEGEPQLTGKKYLALESLDLGLLFSLTESTAKNTFSSVEASQGKTATSQGLVLTGLTDKKKNVLLTSGLSAPLFSITVRDCSPETKDRNTLKDTDAADKTKNSSKTTTSVTAGKNTADKVPEIIFDSASEWKSVEIIRKNEGILFSFTGPKAVPDLDLTALLSVHYSTTKKGIELEFEYRINSKKYSVLEVSFPTVKLRSFSPGLSAFYPTGPGIVLPDPIGTRVNKSNPYPTGFGAPMSWMQVYDNAEGTGLYFAIHDPRATARYLTMNASSGSDLVLECRYPAADKTRPGNSWKIPGQAHWEIIDGDWYDGAMIYRDWVRREAQWYPQLGPEGRLDTPDWMKRLSLWGLGGHGDPRALVKPIQEFQKAFGVPTGFHWYNWHEIPFDNDYPHFLPAKKGFKEAVLELQKDDKIFIMPYINGRLWDSKDKGMDDWQFTSTAFKGVSKKEDGSPVLESYHSKEKDGNSVKLGVMCPTTEVWQAKMREVVLRLMNEEGVAAVYMDQIAASQSSYCMDPTHKHSLGGGDWWCPAYWEMLHKIRSDMKKNVDDYPICPEQKEILKAKPDLLKNRMLTTECNMEPQAAIFDGYLTWHWQFDHSVPAFPVVYGGVVQMFGRSYGGNPLAWRMKAAEELVFGEQIGWFSLNVMKDPQKFPFIKEIVDLRTKKVEYFYKGEMIRPIRFKDPIPQITEDWKWSGANWPVTADAVRTSTWRQLDFYARQKGITKVNSVLILFSNYTENTYKSRISLNLTEMGLKSGHFKIRRIDARSEKTNLPESILSEKLEFPANSSWALELIPQ